MDGCRWIISRTLISFCYEKNSLINFSHQSHQLELFFFANYNLTDFDVQVAISMDQECAAIARETRIQIDKLN